MNIIQVLFYLSCLNVALCFTDPEANTTAHKDMYVVKATVYQVGILTNQTNDTAETNTGHQEAITIYHNNGSTIDMSAIPEPLVTNVTAEKAVGVAPVTSNGSVPWEALKQLISNSQFHDKNMAKSRRDVSNAPVEVVKGAAVIPSEAGVKSIALPPLLTLNKNLSEIPVPIPNLSVVSYARVNTLVHSP